MDGLLPVDDRDGRVLAEFTDPIEAFRSLEGFEGQDPQLARAFSLVRFDERQGSIVATEATTRPSADVVALGTIAAAAGLRSSPLSSWAGFRFGPYQVPARLRARGPSATHRPS